MSEKKHIVEAQWEHEGFPCVCIIHPLYKVSYDQEIAELRGWANRAASGPIGKMGILTMFCAALEGRMSATPEHVIQVHGSITFSGGDEKYPIAKPGYWWFGFDCAHCDDAADPEFMDDETLRIMKPLMDMIPNRQIRTLDYVRNECNSMAEQFAELERELKSIIAARGAAQHETS